MAQQLNAPRLSNRLGEGLRQLRNDLRARRRDEEANKRYEDDLARRLERQGIQDERYEAGQARIAKQDAYVDSERAKKDYTNELLNQFNTIKTKEDQAAFDDALRTSGGFDANVINNAIRTKDADDLNAKLKEAQIKKLNTPDAPKYTAHYQTNPETGAKVKVGSEVERLRAEKAGYTQLGQLPKGKGGSKSSSAKSIKAEAKSYGELKKQAGDFGYFDKEESVQNIEALQAFGVPSQVVQDILTKQENAGFGVDKRLEYGDLNKYGPGVLDTTTGKTRPLGDVLKFAMENEGFEIVLGKDGNLTFSPAKPTTSQEEVLNSGSKNNVSTDESTSDDPIKQRLDTIESGGSTVNTDTSSTGEVDEYSKFNGFATNEEIEELKRLNLNNKYKASKLEDKLNKRIDSAKRQQSRVEYFKIGRGTHPSQIKLVSDFGLKNDYDNASSFRERIAVIEKAKRRQELKALRNSFGG